MVAGFDVFNHPLDAKRRTGYLPETPPLYPDMTVREYLDFVARIKGVPSSERKTARVGGDGARTRRRHGGTSLRQSFRRATGSASVSRRRSFTTPTCSSSTSRPRVSTPSRSSRRASLIRSLAGDHTIVLSTHILPEVAQTCQRVVIINKGRVVAVDTPDNLTARLKGAATMYVQVDAAGADAGAALRRSRASRGWRRSITARARRRGPVAAFEVESEPDVDVRRDLARAVVTRGWGLLELRPVRMSLEDVFLQVTTEEMPEEAARA